MGGWEQFSAVNYFHLESVTNVPTLKKKLFVAWSKKDITRGTAGLQVKVKYKKSMKWAQNWKGLEYIEAAKGEGG